MKAKLRILLLEDNLADAELIAAQLEGAGFSFQLEAICSEADLRKELEKEVPDLILSDHGFPSFNGFRALNIVRGTHPDLPFIFVSGTNDQGVVARMYDQGATDYVYKRDLGDLKPAVLRAMEMKRETPPPSWPKPVVVSEPELNLQPPPVPPAKPAAFSNTGYLLFCPRCRRIRDEAGEPVPVASECADHVEIVIRRQICPECVPPVRPV